MWKGTISCENVHLGIQIVSVENAVLSTSFRSFHEECIALYIHIHLSRLSRKSMFTRKLRFGAPSSPSYLLKPDCSTHMFIWTLLFQGQSTNFLHIVTKNECVGECLDQLHSLYSVCVKSKTVQIAKIQTSLLLYFRTKSSNRFGVCD